MFIIFRDGEGGFNGRKTVTIPLVSIDDYVDVIDRYAETDSNIYEIKQLMVNKNNIFYFEEQWGQDVGIVVLLKENVLEGISTSIWCVIPFNNVINMTAENFFESVWD